MRIKDEYSSEYTYTLHTMPSCLPVLLVGLALAAGQWDRQMELHRLDEADYPLAKCNDGTQVMSLW